MKGETMNAHTDEKGFLIEMTNRICSSLDIQKALERCTNYITKFIPMKSIDLSSYDEKQNLFRVVASVTKYGKPVPKIYKGTEAMRKEILRQSLKKGEVRITNNPIHDAGIANLHHSLELNSDVSIMGMQLRIERENIGHLIISAKGIDQYTPHHAHLFSLLHDPFAIAMANALKHQEVIKLKDILDDDYRYLQKQVMELSGAEIVGMDFGLRDVMEMVRQVAKQDSPVILFGETGVGKDVIAKAIHQLSDRSEGPFIKVNCGAIPETLIDSELFGHEKGAFTGALAQKRGRFERANTGTVFLDEIAELPLQAQVRFLNVVQNKEIERVGGSRSIPVDVRIISATNSNLQEMVDKHQFREDLWFRLNVFPIMIPPLHERKDDIPMLTHYFLEKKARMLKINEIPPLKNGAMSELVKYDWPGNIRELENVIERALIRHREGPLSFDVLDSNSRYHENKIPFSSKKWKPLTLDELNSRHIRYVMQMTGGKINGPGGTAEMLGIHPNTLRRRMDKLKITYGRGSN
jgi:hydrogenase-4 transcriptional activator